MVAGIGLLVGWSGAIYWLVSGVVISYFSALADAWVLLVEINR